MSRLFEIISTYRSELTLLPTMILIFVLATVLCYVVFNRYRWVKYLPALVGIAMGIFNVLSAFSVFTTPAGLDQMWAGIVYFVAGCIALATAWIIAMLSSGERKNAKAKKKERQLQQEEHDLQLALESEAREQEEMHQADLELAQAVQDVQAKQANQTDEVIEAVDPIAAAASVTPVAGEVPVAPEVSHTAEIKERPSDETRVYRNVTDLIADYEAHEEPVKVYEPKQSKSLETASKELEAAAVSELGHAEVHELREAKGGKKKK